MAVAEGHFAQARTDASVDTPQRTAPVVAKYGGSSLATPQHILGIADHIATQRAQGVPLVVVVSAMGDTTDDLIALARAVTRTPDARELDLLMATGELVSAALLVMALHDRDVAAISLSGPQAGILTDGSHGRARITGVEPSRVRQELDNGRVVVVAGFQGASGTEIATLGRGGSDTSAVALAITLGADRCDIYTDVDGVYTADPRLVPDARRMDVIGYEEMLELAHQGAKVLQTRSVELAWVHNLEVRVRHPQSPDEGTSIKEVAVEARHKVRGIATDDGMAKVTLLDLADRPGMAAEVFAPLADAGIPVDGIIQNVGHDGATDLSFIVSETDLPAAERLLRGLLPELRASDLDAEGGFAKVSIVGSGIHNAPGYPAKMFSALGEAGINIEMITTSEIRITCLIESAQLAKAAKALHHAFELEQA